MKRRNMFKKIVIALLTTSLLVGCVNEWSIHSKLVNEYLPSYPDSLLLSDDSYEASYDRLEIQQVGWFLLDHFEYKSDDGDNWAINFEDDVLVNDCENYHLAIAEMLLDLHLVQKKDIDLVVVRVADGTGHLLLRITTPNDGIKYFDYLYDPYTEDYLEKAEYIIETELNLQTFKDRLSKVVL